MADPNAGQTMGKPAFAPAAWRDPGIRGVNRAATDVATKRAGGSTLKSILEPMRPDYVLITRPEPGASETATRVAAMDLTPIIAPLLRIRPVPRLPSLPAQIAAVLLASGSAVDPLPVELRGLPVLTVGSATARRATQAGFSTVSSADGDAVALAAMVRERIRPRDGTLLLAAGRGQSLALAAELRASGYRVARRVVYSSEAVARLPVAAAKALTGGKPLTILLFSAATARHFMRLVRRAGLLAALRDREAITIGPPSAMALEPAYWARVRVAGKPTQDEMLALLR
jgi:uroporphyrinogen-III synthase